MIHVDLHESCHPMTAITDHGVIAARVVLPGHGRSERAHPRPNGRRQPDGGHDARRGGEEAGADEGASRARGGPGRGAQAPRTAVRPPPHPTYPSPRARPMPPWHRRSLPFPFPFPFHRRALPRPPGCLSQPAAGALLRYDAVVVYPSRRCAVGGALRTPSSGWLEREWARGQRPTNSARWGGTGGPSMRAQRAPMASPRRAPVPPPRPARHVRAAPARPGRKRGCVRGDPRLGQARLGSRSREGAQERPPTRPRRRGPPRRSTCTILVAVVVASVPCCPCPRRGLLGGVGHGCARQRSLYGTARKKASATRGEERDGAYESGGPSPAAWHYLASLPLSLSPAVSLSPTYSCSIGLACPD
eukprot:scaffold1318_cov388-Prasinococcus_capsulatus_cf.AAC.10